MRKLKTFYVFLSITSIAFGISLFLSSRIKFIGAVIGVENMPFSTSFSFGSFFVFMGFLLFVMQKRDKSLD